MYDGYREGFYVGVCAEVSLYVDSYDGVEMIYGIYGGVCTELFLYVDSLRTYLNRSFLNP